MGDGNALTVAGRAQGRPRIAFIYAGRRGSVLETTLALHGIAKKAGMDSQVALSSDNTRGALVRRLYPDAEFYDFFSPASMLRLMERLRGRVAFFTLLSPKMLLPFLAFGGPKIFYFHATYDREFSRPSLRDLYYELMHDVLIRASTKTVATQPPLAKQIKDRLGIDAGWLPHPSYAPIKAGLFSAEEPVRLPFRKDEYFLNFGELSRESKGTGLLLEAVRGTDLPVVLAGRKRGVREGRNVFHLDQWVSDGQLHWLVRNCRAVVLPYLLRSQFSGCLALAFHFGKPVLAPRTQTFEGWVEEGKTGWLFGHADAGDLREKMRGIASGRLKFSKSAIMRKEAEREKQTASALAKILAESLAR